MLMAEVPLQPTCPCCPRCGYDQSGQVGAWVEACPLAGTCTECGLGLEWELVMNPGRAKLPGFIEHVSRLSLVAAWRTWWLALRPPVFWRRIILEMEPRIGRMLTWLLLLLVPLLVVCAAIPLGTMLLGAYFGYPGAPTKALLMSASVGLLSLEYNSANGFDLVLSPVHPAFVGPLAATAVIPATFLCLPQTRRVSKVRAAHVTRAAVYSLAWVVPILLVYLAIAVSHFASEVLTLNLGVGPTSALLKLNDVIPEFAYRWWLPLLCLTQGWLLLWWYLALQRGFRIEHGARVWLALAIPGCLAAVCLIIASPFGLSLVI
jgi:hypothetical protein